MSTSEILKRVLSEGRYKSPEEKKAEEAQKMRWARFQTGDHVHKRNRYSRTPGTGYTHGVVVKHTGNDAHVEWEDGSKSAHSQHSGEERGKGGKGLSSGMSRYYSSGSAISHNHAYGSSPHPLKNDEHKVHLADEKAKHEASQAHESSHSEALAKLNSMHHSYFKPEHLEQLHKIHAEVQANRDAQWKKDSGATDAVSSA